MMLGIDLILLSILLCEICVWQPERNRRRIEEYRFRRDVERLRSYYTAICSTCGARAYMGADVVCEGRAPTCDRCAAPMMVYSRPEPEIVDSPCE